MKDNPISRVPAIVIVSMLVFAGAFGQGKPWIQFDNISKDAGTVQQGDVIKQVFTFVNKGGGTLEIAGIEHS